MRAFTGQTVPKCGLALVASVACLAVVSCSETASPARGGTDHLDFFGKDHQRRCITGTDNRSAGEGLGKSYGGTAYFGCPEKLSVSKSALEDIRPKIFDPKTGQYVAPAVPTVAAGENLTGAICALTGTADDMKVVYIVTTVKPAQAQQPEVTEATAYAYDFKGGQPSATKELQPPTPDLKMTAAKDWGLASTASGVAWTNAFTDGHATTSPPRTEILSGGDLSVPWNDPQAGRAWQDVRCSNATPTPPRLRVRSCAGPTARQFTRTTTSAVWTPNYPMAQTNW